MNSEILRNVENGINRAKRNTNFRNKIEGGFRKFEKNNARIFEEIDFCEKCNNILKYNGKQTPHLIHYKCCTTRNSNFDLKR